MIWQGLVIMFYHPALATVLGWVFGIAILLGALLNNAGRDLRGWITAVTLFSILNALAAFAVMDEYSQANALHITLFAVVVTGLYCLGLAVGWAIVTNAKHQAAKKAVSQDMGRIEKRIKDKLTNKGDKDGN